MLASGTIDDPQSWNRYLYAANNPVRYIDPTGLWDWDASAGGKATDEELRARSQNKNLKKSERKAVERALTFREHFRAARQQAENAASSNQLSQSQQQQVQESVAAYGSENDSNGVMVAVRNNTRGSAATTLLNDDETITVTFNAGLKGDKMAVVLAHEGRHVGDAQAWLNSFPLAFGETDLNHYQREHADGTSVPMCLKL